MSMALYATDISMSVHKKLLNIVSEQHKTLFSGDQHMGKAAHAWRVIICHHSVQDDVGPQLAEQQGHLFHTMA